MSKLNNYEFTLVLEGVDDKTEYLEDNLYEAGCDDALINFRNGTVYLDFSREAANIENAIISAIKNVEGVMAGVKVISVLPDHIVSEIEIASRLNISRQTVSLWAKKKRRETDPFPNPISKLSHKSPMWRWYDVAKWLYEHKILTDKKIVEFAKFIEHLNAVLGERDPIIQAYRHGILRKLCSFKRNLSRHRREV